MLHASSYKTLSLVAIVTGETCWVRTDARSFQLNVTGEQLMQMYSVVRLPQTVWQQSFSFAFDAPAESGCSVVHQVLERAAQLVFRLPRRQ